MQFRATEGTASTGKPVLLRKNFLTKSRQKVYAEHTQNVVKFFPKQKSRHTKMGDSVTIHVSFAKHTCPFCKLHTCKWAFSLVEMGRNCCTFPMFLLFFYIKKNTIAWLSNGCKAQKNTFFSAIGPSEEKERILARQNTNQKFYISTH